MKIKKMFSCKITTLRHDRMSEIFLIFDILTIECRLECFPTNPTTTLNIEPYLHYD